MAEHIYCVGLNIGLRYLELTTLLAPYLLIKTLLQKLTIPANIMQKHDEELDHAIALSLLDDDHRQGTGKFALLDHVHMSVSSFYI